MNIEEEINQLSVVNFPHPALRRRAKPIVKVDRWMKRIVERMFELMYEHKGIGLAANQVNLPMQLFIINLEADPQKGQEQVFINPVIESPRGSKEAEEGCLSIPSVYGKVLRPEEVRIKAYGIDGSEIDEVVNGMLARCVQHEYDHLQGVLFPDRMSESSQKNIESDLQSFALEFESERRQGQVGSDEAIEERLIEFEKLYCGT